MRLLIAFCLSLTIPVASLAAHSHDGEPRLVTDSARGSNTASESALAPALVFMRHCLASSSFAIRQLLSTSHEYALAGGSPTRKRVWEFAPSDRAESNGALSPLRMDDQSQRSVGSLREAAGRVKSKALLELMRQTPLRVGVIKKRKRWLKYALSQAIVSTGVQKSLADRISYQLILKIPRAELGDEVTWRAIGRQLRDEAEELKNTSNLTDRQIVIALPKLSPHQIGEMLSRLELNPRIVPRTILHAAVWSSDPVRALEIYARNYEIVADLVSQMDSRLAHRVAKKAFTSKDPRAFAARVLDGLRAPRSSTTKMVLLPLAVLVEHLLRGHASTAGEMTSAIMAFVPFASPPFGRSASSNDSIPASLRALAVAA